MVKVLVKVFYVTLAEIDYVKFYSAPILFVLALPDSADLKIEPK
jgi:hypothetical protein